MRKTGDPYCSNCNYALTGATESSKCPECGKPLVDVLERHQVKMNYSGKRYRSTTQLFGLPLIDIALGPVEGEIKGRAKGFIAIGDIATGWLAIGGIARGFVSVGGLAIGVFSVGGMSLGLLSAVGGCAVGALAAGGCAIGGLANGGGAVGYVAQGGAAVGYYARGGGAYGIHTISRGGSSSQEAYDMFDTLSWYFGSGWPSSFTAMQPLLLVFFIVLAVAAGLAMLGWMKWAKHGSGGVVRFPRSGTTPE